ncbi:efflux RND transporter periplasmic adaptor subunit [Haliangium sp.]|uniref:efflux RND transporter periplasmic adaptor subunit n=1 Tax=Haliangium sp. TaxID=2663208 RepID=UPI003D13C1A1
MSEKPQNDTSADPPAAPAAPASRDNNNNNNRRTRRTIYRWIKRIVLTALAVMAAGALVIAFLPKPVPVDVATAARGPMEVAVREDGKTRIKHRYELSAPISGNLLRIEHRPGDEIETGAPVARIVPAIPPLLDARTRAEAEARLDAALAAQRQAAVHVERARTANELAAKEAQRQRDLGARAAVAQAAVDRAVFEERVSEEDLASARFATKVATHQVAVARAALGRLQGKKAASGTTEEIAIEAPVNGSVLRVYQESEAVVPAGKPLLEVGDPRSLEVVVDVLTRDAVHISPGAAAAIERWGGDEDIAAHVRRIEPSAFTRLSALGVEEQRVNVLVDFDAPYETWSALGDGYRVEVSITIWKADDVLTVPVSAVFRHGEDWAVYVAEGGVATLTPVEVGRRNQNRAQILSGIRDGTTVVVHPSDRVQDGVTITPRHQ